MTADTEFRRTGMLAAGAGASRNHKRAKSSKFGVMPTKQSRIPFRSNSAFFDRVTMKMKQ